MLRRRKFLQACGLAGLLTTAGCSFPGSSSSSVEPGGVYGSNRDGRAWRLTVRVTRFDDEEGRVLETEVSEDIPAGEFVKLYQVVEPGDYEFDGTNGHDSSTVLVLGKYSSSDDPEYHVLGPNVIFSLSGRDEVTGSQSAGE